jgi:enediyne biosynthesis protein E4
LSASKSNRTGIGARLKVVAQTGTPLLNAKPGAPLVQIDEVRSCNGYYSASDLRIHFGLGDAKKVDLLEIRWPSGVVDTLEGSRCESALRVEEGGKILKTETLCSI